MSDDLVIQRATREQVKLRLAFQGVSGGGKTATMLLVARGMVEELGRRGKLPDLDCHIGLIDTENDSASLYSHLVDFDRIVLSPPYSVDRYLKCLSSLEAAGYSVIITDQISHEWEGPGGILDQVGKSKAYNDFAKWNGPSQDHDRFIDRYMHSPAHILCSMRAKTEHSLEEQETRPGSGVFKKVPVRIGIKPKQREGTEYEFTCLFDLAHGTNAATCLKDRTEMFPINQVVPRDAMLAAGNPSQGMGIAWGAKFIEWVYSAKKAAAPPPEVAAEERCIAVADAGIRACQRTANVPDLESAYLAQRNAIGAYQPTAGADVVTREIGRLKDACAAHKASFGAAGGVAQVAPSGGPISPDDCANLETLLSDAGVLAADVKAHFKVPRLAALAVSQWDTVVAWVIAGAAERGIVLKPVAHVPDAPAPASPKAVTDGIIEKIAQERGGLFTKPTGSAALATMPDDLPWAD